MSSLAGSLQAHGVARQVAAAAFGFVKSLLQVIYLSFEVDLGGVVRDL